MTDRPLLIFPASEVGRRIKKKKTIKGASYPSHQRQKERLAPQFQELARAFNAKRASLRGDSVGSVPEQVLVLETIDGVDGFLSAVRGTSGMEWLGVVDIDGIQPDEDFFQDKKNPDKPLSGRLYLVLSDQKAIDQMLSLWRRYIDDPEQ